MYSTVGTDSINAVFDEIKKYDDDIVIYPGHGIKSLLGTEKKYNLFFNN